MKKQVGALCSLALLAGSLPNLFAQGSQPSQPVVDHGFVRAPDGTFTTFDPPGSVFTNNSGINPVGTVTSWYTVASGLSHGYVRAPTGSSQGSSPENINAEGAITGQYVDARGVNHGFLRAKKGAITTFDVSGAGTGSGQGTIPISNNPANAISGFYFDASGVAHGFLRTH